MFRFGIYISVIIFYILYILFDSHTLLTIVGILANIAMILALFRASGLYLYSGIIFYVLGIYFFVTENGQEYFTHFHSMLGVLSLFIVLPFLNALILIGDYDKHLNKILQYKVLNLGHLYTKSTFVSHILGLFLNIATVPILIKSLHNSLKDFPSHLVKSFYSKSILRAYAFCLMWSPMEIMVIQTLEITGGTYIMTAPFLLLLVSLFLWINIGFGKKAYHSYSLSVTNQQIDISMSKKKITELFILLFILVLAVSLLDMWLQKGYLFSLVLLMVPICIIWASKLRTLPKYIKYVLPHWKVKVTNLSNFYFMFIGAGFFVAMLANTNLIHTIQMFILNVGSSKLILYTIICVYFFVTSLLGFHPLVSIVLLAEMLQPMMAALHVIPLSIVMIVGSLSTVTYSPFHASTSILAAEIQVNPYRIGIWNIPFIFLVLSITIIFAYLLDILLALFC